MHRLIKSTMNRMVMGIILCREQRMGAVFGDMWLYLYIFKDTGCAADCCYLIWRATEGRTLKSDGQPTPLFTHELKTDMIMRIKKTFKTVLIELLLIILDFQV